MALNIPHGWCESHSFHLEAVFHFVSLFVCGTCWVIFFGELLFLFSRFSSKEPVKLSSKVSASKKTLFLLCERIEEMSRAACTLLSSRKAGDLVMAAPSSLADSASPCALMMICCLSYSACSTKYFALSAYCWAICFSSIALVNSCPKLRSVIDTSSRTIWKSLNLY